MAIMMPNFITILVKTLLKWFPTPELPHDLIMSTFIFYFQWFEFRPPLWSKWLHARLSHSGPGFDPRSGQVSWVRFFRGFSSHVRQMSGNFRPPRSPNIIWPSSSFHLRLVRMTECMLGVSVCLVCIVFHVCAVSKAAPALGWSLIRGSVPRPCVVKKICMWSIV